MFARGGVDAAVPASAAVEGVNAPRGFPGFWGNFTVTVPTNVSALWSAYEQFLPRNPRIQQFIVDRLASDAAFAANFTAAMEKRAAFLAGAATTDSPAPVTEPVAVAVPAAATEEPVVA